MLPSSGQTLALAEPEARLYNHPTPSPIPVRLVRYLTDGHDQAKKNIGMQADYVRQEQMLLDTKQ